MLGYPEISVVIPVWNQERYIKQAVESTFQNKCNVEVVVLNDGSTDNTWSVLNTISTPPNVILILKNQQKTGNMGFNLHTLYSSTTGEYIVELGSDDYLLPNSLDVLLREARTNPNAGLIYSGYYQDRGGQLQGPIPNPLNKYYQWTNNPQDRLLENNFVTPPCAVKRSLYERVQYDITQEINEDYLFKLEMSRITEFYQIKEPLGVLRIRSDSISNNPNTKDKMRYWEDEARRKVILKYGK